jgi:cellulose synthase operon protein C
VNKLTKALFAAIIPFLVAQADAAPKKAPVKKAAKHSDARSGKKLDIQRKSVALPSSKALQTPEAKQRDLREVKPPRSGEFYGGNEKEVEYEKLLDEEMRRLYQLSTQHKRSRSRGEIWLRLAEAYVEKSQLIEFRRQSEYDVKIKAFLEKKTTVKPRLDLSEARDYNKKAIALYEWFIRDFPQDKKMDQALFFLGLNHFDTGDVKAGEKYYQKLVKEYPNSPFITDSHFALGEYYFENDRWQPALDNYLKVIQKKSARLNTLAMFKAAWCLYRTNRVTTALKMLERVVKVSRTAEAAAAGGGDRRSVNRVRLASEALKDYVPFYAEAGDPTKAPQEFARVAQDESLTFKMLERLAYTYADAGNRVAAASIFKDLIAQNPSGERAAEYQYQILLGFATSDQKRFREELVTWLEDFGPKSSWAETNAKNAKLLEETAKLQETTLRNYVLQMHAAAQNSRAQFSQQQASAGYALYNKYFTAGANVAEMQFFHGELLFDMGKFSQAASAYMKSSEIDPKGKYNDKAVTNAVLALEKDLPTAESIEKRRGDSVEAMPLDPEVARFERAAQRYFEVDPKGEKVSDIKRRLGVLYYSYNHFDKAMAIFEDILKTDPKSQNAEIAGNLLLDIYKLRGDMAGLSERANQLLANPAIAKSKFGEDIKTMLEKAGYLSAQKASEGGDHATAAKQFEEYANKYRTAETATAARFNAAVSYEKAGDIGASIRNHRQVLAIPTKDPKVLKLQNDSRNAIARLYQQTGQLDLAAKQYESYAIANPKDPVAINAYFNAAVIYDGLGEYTAAVRNYEAYLTKSKKSDRYESIFAEAEIARKRNRLGQAAALYDTYLKSPAREVGNIMKAHFYYSQISQRLGRVTKAKEGYQRTIATHKAFARQGKEAGVQYAAESRFILAQEVLTRIKQIRFTANDRQQARAATELKQLREKYIAEMKDVIRFDYGPMIVAALASSGQMFDFVVASLSRIPVPAGFNAEEGAKYKELIGQEINNIKNEAKNSYKAAVDKSIELEAFSDWSRIARRGLSQYDPQAEDPGEIPATPAAVDWMNL